MGTQGAAGLASADFAGLSRRGGRQYLRSDCQHPQSVRSVDRGRDDHADVDGRFGLRCGPGVRWRGVGVPGGWAAGRVPLRGLPAGNSKGMSWVLTAVDNIDPENSTEPGWVQAAALCYEYPTLAMGMARIMEMDPRQRDSVAITMRKAITPWLRTSLLDREGFEPFTPEFLDDPLATLFILAPADGTVAGSAVTLLDSLVRRWREKTSARAPMHRLLMVIDELPNTAPIPNLRRIVGEGRGLGINLMVAVQASSQLDTVYGSVYANELRDIFPASVIMFGAREEELLTAAEHWSGLTNRRPQGFGQNDGGKNLNNDLGATLRWQELLPPTREHARLLIRGGVGTCVEIPDWSVFLELYDQTSQAILARAKGQGTDPGTVGPGKLRRMVRRMWADRDNAT